MPNRASAYMGKVAACVANLEDVQLRGIFFFNATADRYNKTNLTRIQQYWSKQNTYTDSHEN